ncbi:polyprenyl synthetase family protein [Nocardia sp. NPDC058705]|uniref:polyprenyl synthetase family protein n=1 Tax=Nocardia sp. NPDC058705 TaxID=3346609 RepID=UPI0036C20D8F
MTISTTGIAVEQAPAVDGREPFRTALRTAVESLPESIRHIAGYHFGWWDPDGNPEHADGGKSLRPNLVLLAGRAVGADLSQAMPAALAVELVHNFSLLHDDVMDRDTTRRHRATAWHVFGIGPAILAGDALVTLAFDGLARTGARTAESATRVLSAAVLNLVEGQTADMAFERRSDVSVPECVAMVDRKTGALFGCSGALGALAGDAGPGAIAGLQGFGNALGRAFQHADDLLGIWGDPAVTGKPAHSDLRNRKKSLPVVWALNSATPEARALAELYGRDAELDDDDLVRAAELVESAGGRDWSRSQIDQLFSSAMLALSGVRGEEGAVAELRNLAASAARRDS